jgi:hypothetical protein
MYVEFFFTVITLILVKGDHPNPHTMNDQAHALFWVECLVVLLAPASDPHWVDAVWFRAPLHTLDTVRIECKVVLPAPASGRHFKPAVWFRAQQCAAMRVAKAVRNHRGASAPSGAWHRLVCVRPPCLQQRPRACALVVHPGCKHTGRASPPCLKQRPRACALDG